MIALDNGDKIRGDAAVANMVDYLLFGFVGTVVTQLADGQLAAAIGDLYTAGAAGIGVSSIVLVNTDTVTRVVNLYLTPNAGTARRLTPKDYRLPAGYSLHTDGVSVNIFPSDPSDVTLSFLLETGQLTAYHAADDGDYEMGVDKAYTINTIGDYSGTVNIDVPHYAGNQIAFAATTPGTITDGAAGLVTFLTGDTIVVRGSALNDGIYTVSTGGVAGTIRTTQPTLLEAAGTYVSICKRTTHSNNYVEDDNTTLGWTRYTSNGEKVGAASDGTLVWYDAALVFILHPAAGDLQIIAASNTLTIVGGAGEVARYHVGDVIDCAGFANAVNNLPGYEVMSVTVNGADLDIVLEPFNNTLISEAAAGARSIGLVCQTIFAYCAATNAASLGGYTDWRVPNTFELQSILDMEAPTGVPDAAAFPGWSVSEHWTATTRPSFTTRAHAVWFAAAQTTGSLKTNVFLCALVRGG